MKRDKYRLCVVCFSRRSFFFVWLRSAKEKNVNDTRWTEMTLYFRDGTQEMAENLLLGPHCAHHLPIPHYCNSFFIIAYMQNLLTGLQGVNKHSYSYILLYPV